MRQPLIIRRGRYDLILPLGEGRLTRVYLASTVGSNNTVVVKRLRPELAQHGRLCADFSAAAHLGTRLRHPQIAETYEVFTEGGEQLFAMEYLEGQTLADLLRRVSRERMPLEEHLLILSLALAGLAHCHALVLPDGRPCGGNHREASASNIFITYDGQVKLMDFALQESLAPGLGSRDDAHRGIGPLAPEQLCGLAVDARSDVFAMGILLWEALARRPRAVGDDRAALIAARVAGSEPGFEALLPGLPGALIDVCARAAELDPAGRYSGPGEMRDALEVVRLGMPRVATPAGLAALVARNFQLDREALRRRIDQHLHASPGDAAQPAAGDEALEGQPPQQMWPLTPPASLHRTPTPTNERAATVPGRIPARISGARDVVSDEVLVPAPAGGRRLVLLGAAAALVLLVAGGIARFRDPPGEPAATAGRSRGGPAWEPIGRPPVAVERAGQPAGAVRGVGASGAGGERTFANARGGAPSFAPPPAAPPSPASTRSEPAPKVVTIRPRPRRASASLTDAITPRRGPVPLLDVSGGVVNVPRPPASPARPAPSEDSARSAPAPTRRQLDEQDPYR